MSEEYFFFTEKFRGKKKRERFDEKNKSQHFLEERERKTAEIFRVVSSQSFERNEKPVTKKSVLS